MSSASPRVSGPASRVLELAAEDPQLQQLMPDEAVSSEVIRSDQTLAGIVSTILSGYGPRPALGQRGYAVADDGGGPPALRWRPEFETITYAELGHRARAVAAVWQLDEGHRVEPGQA